MTGVFGTAPRVTALRGGIVPGPVARQPFERAGLAGALQNGWRGEGRR